jgi:uncharacterized protein YqgC (DUF456 family)
MEIFYMIIGILFIILGLIGCFIPVLPGPPLAYISLLLLQLGPAVPFTFNFMMVMGIIVAIITAIDYFIPALGAKKWGGSRYGIIGALLGVVVGLFIFPPLGFVIFPFIGAIMGEIINGANTNKALKAAFGTLIGLIFGTMLKFSVSLIIAYYFFSNL